MANSLVIILKGYLITFKNEETDPNTNISDTHICYHETFYFLLGISRVWCSGLDFLFICIADSI